MRLHVRSWLRRFGRQAFKTLLLHPKVASKYISKSKLFSPAWYVQNYGESGSSKDRLIESYLRASERSPHPLFDTGWYKGQYPQVAKSKLNPLVYFLQVGAQLGQCPTALFDIEWYLDNNEDVRATKTNPFLHYVNHGWHEGRSPHPLFDMRWYEAQLAERHDGPFDLLAHYISEGWRLGLSPHPLFDPKFYCQLYPDAAGQNPLMHFVKIGSAGLRRTHFLFEPAWYLQKNPDVAAAGLSPLLHFLRSGWKEKRDPMALFDTAWYLFTNPDVADAGVNAFLHYLRTGGTEKRSPHPLFDGKWYLERYKDVDRTRVNPLLHYCSVGWAENRNPHPLFDGQWYLQQSPNLDGAGLNPLRYYVQSGYREALSPHPLFDAFWYLDRYPDVAEAGLDPLRHYLTSGWRENRNPGPFFNTSWYRESYDYDGQDCPLAHYLSQPNPNIQSPHPLFDADWYVKTYEIELDKTKNCYVDYVTIGINANRLPSPHYNRVVDAVGNGYGTQGDIARHTFESMFAVKGIVDDIRRVAREQLSVLDTHYEIWKTPEPFDDKVVCLLVVYAPDGYLPGSTLHFLSALRRRGVRVVLIAATQNSGKPYADQPFECDGLLSRDNFGFDFAGWALALHVMPTIWQARTVIFTNDSIFGPISDAALQNLLDRLEQSSADYLGLTESWQVEHHYQSYFFALNAKALRHPGVKDFWANIRSLRDKDEVIYRYELKTLESMTRLGLRSEVLFPLESIGPGVDANPTLDTWRALIENGFPFLKVQLLRDQLSGIDRPDLQNDIIVDPALKALMMERLDGDREQRRRATIVRPRT